MEAEALPQAYPALAPLADVVHSVQHLYPGMTIQRLTVFLLVADKPGITAQEIVRKAGIAQSSVSRNLAKLGRAGDSLVKVAGAQPGLAAWPTAKGEALAALLSAAL